MYQLRNTFSFEKFADIYFPENNDNYVLMSMNLLALFEYLSRCSRMHLRILGHPRNFIKIKYA